MSNDEKLSKQELLRRYQNQKAYIQHYASCLDGIKEIVGIPGSSIESCRCPGDIRRIVEYLAKRMQKRVYKWSKKDLSVT